MIETFITSHKGLRVNTRRSFIMKVINEEVLFSVHTYYEFKFKIPKYVSTAQAINKDRGYQVIRVAQELADFNVDVMTLTIAQPKKVEQKIYKVEWGIGSVTITYAISGVILTKEQIFQINAEIKTLLRETLQLIKLNCIEYKNETGISWRGLPKVKILNEPSSG